MAGLLDLPGIGPYLAVRDNNQQADLRQVQQMGLLQNMLESAQTSPLKQSLLQSQLAHTNAQTPVLQMQAQQAMESMAREKALRSEIESLGPTATQDQLRSVFLRHGDPKSVLPQLFKNPLENASPIRKLMIERQQAFQAGDAETVKLYDAAIKKANSIEGSGPQEMIARIVDSQIAAGKIPGDQRDAAIAKISSEYLTQPRIGADGTVIQPNFSPEFRPSPIGGSVGAPTATVGAPMPAIDPNVSAGPITIPPPQPGETGRVKILRDELAVEEKKAPSPQQASNVRALANALAKEIGVPGGAMSPPNTAPSPFSSAPRELPGGRGTMTPGSGASKLLMEETKSYSTAMEKSNLPMNFAVLKNVEGKLYNEDGTVKEDVLKYLTGIGGALPDLAMKSQVTDARQALQKMMNIELKDRSGAAVTVPEWERFKKEFGIGLLKKPEQVVEALKQAREIMVRHEQTLSAGFAPEVIQNYKKNLAGMDGQAAPQASSQIQKIMGDADYGRLPSGAEFIGPDGKRRRKP